MPVFENLKTRSRRLIARKRDTASVRALHRLATFIEGCYENDEWDMCVNGEASLLRRLAPARPTTVFDVGAHVGDWSIEALTHWPGAHVHAFEVAAPTYQRLETRIGASGLIDRATLNAVGLSDVTASREMYYFPDHPNLTCDLPRHSFPSRPLQAQLLRGDVYVRQHHIDTIDFLKIDVEGAEHLVLEGLSETIDARKVHCIQFEYGAFSIQTRVLLADYYERLAGRYWLGKIYPGGVEFRDYDWTMETFRFSNFLCVSRRRPDLKAMAAGEHRAGRAEPMH
jgi:FkbM family methyltransferase